MRGLFSRFFTWIARISTMQNSSKVKKTFTHPFIYTNCEQVEYRNAIVHHTITHNAYVCRTCSAYSAWDAWVSQHLLDARPDEFVRLCKYYDGVCSFVYANTYLKIKLCSRFSNDGVRCFNNRRRPSAQNHSGGKLRMLGDNLITVVLRLATVSEGIHLRR